MGPCFPSVQWTRTTDRLGRPTWRAQGKRAVWEITFNYTVYALGLYGAGRRRWAMKSTLKAAQAEAARIDNLPKKEIG